MSNRAFLIYTAAVVVVALVSVQFFYLNYIDHVVAQKEQLKQQYQQRERERREEVEELSSRLEEYEEAVGGHERMVEEEVLNSEIVFPIAEEDFLRYTSPYGRRRSPFFDIEVHHTGVDIAAVWRAQVRAIADGRVIEHYPPPGTRAGGTEFKGHDVYGGMVEVDHGGWTSLYAHLGRTEVNTGDRVSTGEYIGRVGNTGKAKGYHLHLEIEVDGERVNPLLYVDELDFDTDGGSAVAQEE